MWQCGDEISDTLSDCSARIRWVDRSPELDDALQDLSEELGCRLVVLDAGMRAVAWSIHESPEDRRRLAHLLTHSDSWERPRTSRTPQQVIEIPGVGPLLFTRLVDARRQIVGHLVLPSTGSPPPELGHATERLAALLQARQQNAAGRSARAHELTVDLVAGDAPVRARAAEALIAERFLSSSASYCAVALGVDPRTAAPSDHEKAGQAVARTLGFVRETSTATVVGGVLDNQVGVLIFPRPVVVPRLVRILADPQVTPVRAGVGTLMALEEAPRSFEQARLAWRASWLAPRDHGTVTTWDAAGLDATLARMPLESFTRADLPPVVRDLLGAVDSPDLIATLTAYLDAGGDARRTAGELGIHRSTLYYRLDKMRSVIAGDLADGAVRAELHTGLRMARLAGLLPG